MDIPPQAMIMAAVVFAVVMFILFKIMKVFFEASESYPESLDEDMRCPHCGGELEDLMEIESKDLTFRCKDCGKKATVSHSSR